MAYIRPIDPNTLGAIGGQKTAAAASDFASTMMNMYQIRQQAKLQNMQLQREEAEFDEFMNTQPQRMQLAQDKLQAEIDLLPETVKAQAGSTALQILEDTNMRTMNAMSAIAGARGPRGMRRAMEEHSEYLKEVMTPEQYEEFVAADLPAKKEMIYEFAETLPEVVLAKLKTTQTASGASLSTLAKLQRDRAAAIARGDTVAAQELDEKITKETEVDEPAPKYTADRFSVAQTRVADIVGEEDAAGFSDRIANGLNTYQTQIQEVTGKVVDLSPVERALNTELANDDPVFAEDTLLGDDKIDPVELDKFLTKHTILASVGLSELELAALADQKGASEAEILDFIASQKLGGAIRYEYLD